MRRYNFRLHLASQSRLTAVSLYLGASGDYGEKLSDLEPFLLKGQKSKQNLPSEMKVSLYDFLPVTVAQVPKSR